MDFFNDNNTLFQDNTSITDVFDHNHSGGVNNAEDASMHGLYIRTIFMLCLVLVAMNMNGILHKFKFHYLSEAATTIILGLFVAVIFSIIAWSNDNTTIQLSTSFFYMVLLPPIIFEGGFAIRRVAFFKNVLNILLLAFVGALYSTFLSSGMMYYFSKLCGFDRLMANGSTYVGLSLTESLVFGSLISSTDPVTVLSLLPSNVDKRLYMLLFGESALNDAVAIILYRFFSGISDSDAAFQRWGVGPFIVSFFASAGVFLGSFVVGMSFALLFAKITKHIRMHDGPIYETTMLIIFAYLSYLVADVIQLTGIISVFFCGIGMAHYAYPNLETTTTMSLKVTLRFISFVCESFIFLYLGTGLLSFGEKATYNPLMIFFAFLTILVSRSHVFVLLNISNYFKKKQSEKVPLNHQILIWFSGLRGAVAFALGVTFLEHPHFDDTSKHMIFGTTVMVVVLTVFILGGLTPHMLILLKIAAPTDQKGGHDQEQGPATNGTANGHAVVNGNAATEGGKKGGANGYVELVEETGNEDDVVTSDETTSKTVFGFLINFDSRYFRPFFTREQPREDTLEVKSPHLAMSAMADEAEGRTSVTQLKSPTSAIKEKSPFLRDTSNVNNESSADMIKSAQCQDVIELQDLPIN